MTPAMQQYKDMKAKYPDTILFFRMGDFYETFFDDAKETSSILNLALTSRSKGSNKIPMAGIPYHALDTYLPKMIKAGKKVAICEQIEDPKTAKTIVRRDVVRIATPGTFIDERTANTNNNYITSIEMEKNSIGVATIDISTGDYKIYQFEDYMDLLNYLKSYHISELLIEKVQKDTIYRQDLIKNFNNIITYLDKNYYEQISKDAESYLPLTNKTLIKKASMGLINYLLETQKTSLIHLKKPLMDNLSSYMYIEGSSLKNLEILENQGSTINTLFSVLNKTKTTLGVRLLRNFLIKPLRDINSIESRLDCIQYFYNNPEKIRKIQDKLSEVSDIERICSKIGMQTANARDLIALSNSLKVIKEILPIVEDNKIPLLLKLNEKLTKVANLNIGSEIDRILNPEAPLNLKDGGLINIGVDSELDTLLSAGSKGKDWIRTLQMEEIKNTGINSLKIKYNRVFGYYIEISSVHKNKVPDHYIRKQTLVNAERYMTPRLKELEDLILNSSFKSNALEYDIFIKLRDSLVQFIDTLQAGATAIAFLDVLSTLSLVALENNYNRPILTDLDENYSLEINEGRHPVIERLLEPGMFVPNNLYMDDKKQQLIILTGPNMIGKSTFMRQNALIILMAQIGSFVPAKTAKINIVDKIFTRVGASDNLARGESTFMVEMNEVSNILLNATKRSFIILDEVGRGTSTHDGISIARAISEYIHENIKALTLFATHYHELLTLENDYERIVNYSINVEEVDGEVIFLHTIKKGGVDQSYGIHVASMAGLPKSVIDRAYMLLNTYSANSQKSSKVQPALFIEKTDPNLAKVRQRLQDLDIDELTPIDSLNEINKLKRLLNGKN